MKMWEMLQNFVFPSICCFCGELTGYDRAVCPDCSRSVKPISGITCAVCGMEQPFCRCTGTPSEYERCVASFYYEDRPKQGILLLKYGEAPYLARYLCAYMAKQVIARYHGVCIDMVAAVPMHRLKRRKRGYNQAEVLACALAKRLRVTYRGKLLTQIRESRAQHLQHRRERAQNVADIYRLANNPHIKGKTVLLVDDIVTTGATLRECAGVLKAGGAKAVYCVAFCVTKPINA